MSLFNIQETCAFLAIKSLIILCLMRCLSIVALAPLSFTHSSTWTCFSLLIVSLMASMTRHPVILMTSIWNFGPLRNTVGLYVENLPDHIYESVTDPLHRLKENLKRAFTSHDDQRSFVGSADDSDSSYSDEEHSSRRKGIHITTPIFQFLRGFSYFIVSPINFYLVI